MTRSYALLTSLSLALAFALAPTLAAQEEEVAGSPEVTQETQTPILKRSDLVLRYYRTKHLEASRLALAAAPIFGRTFFVDDRTNPPVHNLMPVGKAVAIFDIPNRADSILRQLPAMDEAAASTRAAVEVDPETEVIRIAHISENDASTALAAFTRHISVPGPGGPAQGQNFRNISIVPGKPPTVIIRDTPENLGRIRALLAAIDTPPPSRPKPVQDVTFTCHVVRTGESAEGRQLPPDLATNLKQLVGADHFEDLGMALMRARIGGTVQTEVQLADHLRATLMLNRIKTVDNGVYIDEIRFEMRGGDAQNSLKTGATIAFDEYTVIGAFGSPAYFLVLRVSR
jgi:hypothetical protein